MASKCSWGHGLWLRAQSSPMRLSAHSPAASSRGMHGEHRAARPGEVTEAPLQPSRTVSRGLMRESSVNKRTKSIPHFEGYGGLV